MLALPEHGRLTTALDPDLLSTPFKMQTNWHVITGAQSSGKTTLVGQLAERGFRTVPEAARLYFEREMAKGRTIDEILRDGVALERDLMEMMRRTEDELQARDVIFLDRATPDCLPFFRFFGLNPNEVLAECFHHRYASVFVLDRLPLQGDGLRIVDNTLAAFLDEWLARDYRALGYRVVRVPALPPPERLAFVLARLSDQGLV